jgi:hypothetical protein
VSVELTAEEARVIGSLMEKSVTTPDQYPLTLNSLTSACNQKSSRDPVMALEPGRVQQTVRALESKHLMQVVSERGARVEKYDQRFCNTPFADRQFSPDEFAVICVLLLRGPATPGELRTRCQRLFNFADNDEVKATLQKLISREGSPAVVQLARQPGRQDHQYMHLFCGEVAIDQVVTEPTVVDIPATSEAGAAPEFAASVTGSAPGADRLAALEARVAELETQLAELKAQLGS